MSGKLGFIRLNYNIIDQVKCLCFFLDTVLFN